jgi:tRNA-2-methylthio-N6-dimethylallyladenosine synthase
MHYLIQTFGCQANKADSERIAGVLEAMGFSQTSDLPQADVVVLNTCSVRQSAEDRVYSRMEQLRELKSSKPNLKVVVAGCMIGPRGITPRDSKIKDRLAGADKLVGTQDYSRLWEIFKDLKPTAGEYLNQKIMAKKMEKDQGLVLISSGCNNFCTFCVVPYARGKEISRPFDEIINEVNSLVAKGYKKITLLGQNVNSYGADLVLGKPLGGDRVQINELKRLRKERIQALRAKRLGYQQTSINQQPLDEAFVAGPFAELSQLQNAAESTTVFTLPDGRQVTPIHVKHLGKVRVPTLFPYLLETVAQIPGIETLSFISSNPWDFSDELIDVIAKYANIDRHIHLPVQSGDNNVLKRMNRWYTREEYLKLIDKIKAKIPDVTFGTDIIVGFPGETEAEFEQTLDLCKQVNFKVAFIAEYSIRPGTAASTMTDNVKNWDKKRRFQILDELINHIPHSKISIVKIGNISSTVPTSSSSTKSSSL